MRRLGCSMIYGDAISAYTRLHVVCILLHICLDALQTAFCMNFDENRCMKIPIRD